MDSEPSRSHCWLLRTKEKRRRGSTIPVWPAPTLSIFSIAGLTNRSSSISCELWPVAKPKSEEDEAWISSRNPSWSIPPPLLSPSSLCQSSSSKNREEKSRSISGPLSISLSFSQSLSIRFCRGRRTEFQLQEPKLSVPRRRTKLEVKGVSAHFVLSAFTNIHMYKLTN